MAGILGISVFGKKKMKKKGNPFLKRLKRMGNQKSNQFGF